MSEYTFTHQVLDFTKVAERVYLLQGRCMHCNDPACAAVCPVGAFYKSDEGPVGYRRTAHRMSLLHDRLSFRCAQMNGAGFAAGENAGCHSRVKEGLWPACAGCPQQLPIARVECSKS
jgi:formate dehydrogenase iron-sulfur subunit